MGQRSIFNRLKKITLERDGLVCLGCGSKIKLHTHHIYPKGKKRKDFINNLITLCNKCHFKVHNTLNYGIWINELRRRISSKEVKMSLSKYFEK